MKQTQIPTQEQYERNEFKRYAVEIERVNKAPISERKEARTEFSEALKTPALVGERIGWLLDGSYGWAEQQKALQVLQSPRMNRKAALCQMIAVEEWSCPAEYAIQAWKNLTPSEKARLDEQIEDNMTEHEKQLAEQK